MAVSKESRSAITLSRRLALLCLALVAAGLAHTSFALPAEPSADPIRDACDSPSPYFAAVRQVSHLEPGTRPAILTYRSKPGDEMATPLVLATQAQVGTIYGLAFDANRDLLYAAAYHRRGSAFGPGGPGAIYRVDLATGIVDLWATIDAGPDRHDFGETDDEVAEHWISRSSLGDIDLSDDGTILYVANLHDGRIYRLSTLDGSVLSSFRHGARIKYLIPNPRPLGIGYRDGWLFHGITDVQGSDLGGETARAHLYRSRPDGQDMEDVAQFSLEISRRSDAVPVISDIEFRPSGEPILGIRNLCLDGSPSAASSASCLYWPSGDILPALTDGSRWRVVLDPEHYDDRTVYMHDPFGPYYQDEALMGGLAPFPGLDHVGSTALGVYYLFGRYNIAAFGVRLDNYTGAHVGQQNLFARDREALNAGAQIGLGDLEVLCDRSGVDRPTGTATATPATSQTPTIETASPTPSTTATVALLTETPAPTGTPDGFATEVAASCLTDNPFAATVCYRRTLFYGNPGFDSSSVVVFRNTPSDQPIYNLAPHSAVGSVWGLAFKPGESEVYAAAFQKRGVEFGPEGPGAVYRIGLDSGAVSLFAQVPDAGADWHGPGPGDEGPDAVARDWAGENSLGALEISSDEQALFVMNLSSRRIYRYSVVSGQLLGTFAHGAATESWASDARPFALKFWRGRIYHGLVNSAESDGEPAELRAYVYSSESDGSGMRLELDVPLDYDRGVALLPGLIPGQTRTVPLNWLPWADGQSDLANGQSSMVAYPQPILSDIEFTDRGDMAIALRDRKTDMALVTMSAQDFVIAGRPPAGFGDLLMSLYGGPSWQPPLANYFQGMSAGVADRVGMGSLAAHNPFGVLLASRSFVDASPANMPLEDAQAVWYGTDGNPRQAELVCSVAPWPRANPFRRLGSAAAEVPMHDENIPGQSAVGDIEVLCGSDALATPTPTPSPTASPTQRPTDTPRATRGSSPVYLPIALKESCDPTLVRADVVMAIDTSSSMRGTKIDDAKAAAISFVRLMDLLQDRDQVAVVRFDAEAGLLAELGNGQVTVESAILGLETRRGTRIDQGLYAALDELMSPRRIEGNTPVMVLLTDGRQTASPGAEIDAARQVREAGVRLYVIGLGSDVDEPNLVELAGARSRYYFAPVSGQLEAIYGEVARDIDCPAEDFWGRR